MKIINSSYEILNPDLDFKKAIELAGRTCYKSESNISDNSADKFVQNMIDAGHGAMLEHGTVYFKLSVLNIKDFIRSRIFYGEPHSKVMRKGSHIWVTTNYRVLVEHGVEDLVKYAVLFDSKYHERRISVRFICDRGISHELVRHRVFSFAQESTRYCNYSKSRFGSELTFIEPSCGNSEPFVDALTGCENSYFKLLDRGWTAQKARAVLPNALKTEIIMTGFVSDWKHFFNLRSDTALTGKPHPDMEKLITPLRDEFKARGFI